MININNLKIIKEILNDELSNNLKSKHNFPKIYTQLCILKGDLDVLMKMVYEYERSKK